MDYQEFAKRFSASGMTQREFGEQEGISASMVNYYLRRGRKNKKAPEFTPITVQQPKQENYIVITTNGGTEVKIPV